MSHLEIQLLNSFHLALDGRPLTGANTGRLQSLLAYLLLHRHAPQPRQHVAFLFWPDSPEAQARTNLRNLLHRLRLALPEVARYLKEEGQTLQWRVDASFSLDVAAFEGALADARQAEEVADQTATRRALELAIQLYTGELLPGCYDEWILSHRERLQRTFLEALERLIALLEGQRHYRQAIRHAEHLLRHDPVNEAMYRRLMRLHVLRGDRASALRIYNTCVTVLQQELAVEPSTPTRALYEWLLDDSAPIDPQLMSPGVEGRQTSGNWPHALTSFIGRQRQLDEVKRYLSTARLLTLTGPPGSGKTRLAVEVAAGLAGKEAYGDGVWWVELAGVTHPSLLPQAVASVLGVREKADASLAQTLIEHLGDRSLLLLLDNCEHIIEACSTFATTLLRGCPNLQILTTSREALGVRGEVAWPLPPLTFPEADEWEGQQVGQDFVTRILRYESVRLFVERAAAALPTFRLSSSNATAVARVCSRLEGVPLAIELAAVRTKMIAVEQIADRLDESLRLLRASRDAGLPRHQSLRAAIDWSYTLLSKREQRLFRRLAVFRSGFTLEAAEQVTAGRVDATVARLEVGEILDLLSQLIDKSLVLVVEQEQVGEMRYRLLDIVRQYAWEKLREAGEVEMASREHAHFYLALAESADSKLRGAEQAMWLNRLEAEYDNLRAVLEWARERPDESEVGVRLAGVLWQFWDVHGTYREGRRWLQIFIARAAHGTAAQARALKAAGGLAWSQGDYASARSLLTKSLELQRELGEQSEIAVGLFNLGLVTYSQGDAGGASELLEESLAIFRVLGHKAGIANALNSLGVVASQQGDYVAARPLFEESLLIRRELGDQRGIAVALGNLGVEAWRQGEYAAARTLLRESLERYRELGDRRGMATSLNELAEVARSENEDARAQALHQESLAIWQELGNKQGVATSLAGLAGVACGWGAYGIAARLLGAAEALREATGATLTRAQRSDVELILAKLGAELSEDQVAAARVEGRALTLEAAVALAARVQPQGAGAQTDGAP